MDEFKQFRDPEEENQETNIEQTHSDKEHPENVSEKKEQIWDRVYQGWDDFNLNLEKNVKVFKIIEETDMTESEKRSWGPYITKKYRVGLGIEPDAISQAERLLQGKNEQFRPNCDKGKELEADGSWKGKFKDNEWEIRNSLSLVFFQNEKEENGLESEQIIKPAEKLEEHNVGQGGKILQEIADYLQQKNVSIEMMNGAATLCLAASFFGVALTSKGIESYLAAGEGAIMATTAVAMFVKEASNRFKASMETQINDRDSK
jgi:hypothetical protein